MAAVPVAQQTTFCSSSGSVLVMVGDGPARVVVWVAGFEVEFAEGGADAVEVCADDVGLAEAGVGATTS
jgi:hypothetical protein